jgi:hypothetical protein
MMRGPVSFARRHSVGVASLGLGAVVVVPLLTPGFVLAYDMAFVPSPRLSRELLGLGGSLPRAVPAGLLVALLSRALTGQVLQKLVLVGIFAGAAYGASRLTPATRPPGRIAAGVLYAWNPFTYERLLLGHWALLLGYAALPWVVGAAIAFRRGEPGAVWRVTLGLGASAAASPYTGVIAAGVALAVAAWPPVEPGSARRRSAMGPAVLLAVAIAVNLPWLVPAATHPGLPRAPAEAESLFRARSDSPLGTAGSLLSLGGLWRTDLAPPGRGTVAWVPAFLVIAWVAVQGWRRMRQRWPEGARRGLLAISALGLVLALGLSVPGLRVVEEWLIRAVPGGGILRDSQKFVIPLALLEAVGFGMGVDAVLERISRRDPIGRWAAALLPFLPVALAPTLAWGAFGTLTPARYPPSWARAERMMAADPDPGAVLVLPWHQHLPFAWNHGRTVYQPADLYFSRRTVVSSSLEVAQRAPGGAVVVRRLPEEDPWSRRAASVATGSGPLGPTLSGLGVRWVLLFKEADWRPQVPRTVGLTRVIDSPDLAMYRASPPGPPPRFGSAPAGPVIAGDAVALALLTVAAAARARAARGVRFWRSSRAA